MTITTNNPMHLDSKLERVPASCAGVQSNAYSWIVAFTGGSG